MIWKYREEKEKLEDWQLENFTFLDIDKQFLKSYERWRLMIQQRSKGTVGVDTRNLRTLYNNNKTEYLEKVYPFGKKGGYVIPTTISKNQGLSKADIKKIRDFIKKIQLEHTS